MKNYRLSTLTAIAFIFVCSSQVCLAAVPQAEDRGQGIIERYHADDWCGKSRVCYSCLVKEWPEQLPAPMQAVSHERMDFASYKKELFFLADSENSNRVSRLEVHLAKSVKAAHRSMLTYFSTCAAPQPFPEATEQTGRVGDRCYFGFGETWTSVMFVRNNVFVVLSSSGASFSVRKEAEVIDKEILRLSSVSNNCCNSVSFGDAAGF